MGLIWLDLRIHMIFNNNILAFSSYTCGFVYNSDVNQQYTRYLDMVMLAREKALKCYPKTSVTLCTWSLPPISPRTK